MPIKGILFENVCAVKMLKKYRLQPLAFFFFFETCGADRCNIMARALGGP